MATHVTCRHVFPLARFADDGKRERHCALAGIANWHENFGAEAQLKPLNPQRLITINGMEKVSALPLPLTMQLFQLQREKQKLKREARAFDEEWMPKYSVQPVSDAALSVWGERAYQQRPNAKPRPETAPAAFHEREGAPHRCVRVRCVCVCNVAARGACALSVRPHSHWCSSAHCVLVKSHTLAACRTSTHPSDPVCVCVRLRGCPHVRVQPWAGQSAGASAPHESVGARSSVLPSHAGGKSAPERASYPQDGAEWPMSSYLMSSHPLVEGSRDTVRAREARLRRCGQHPEHVYVLYRHLACTYMHPLTLLHAGTKWARLDWAWLWQLEEGSNLRHCMHKTRVPPSSLGPSASPRVSTVPAYLVHARTSRESG